MRGAASRTSLRATDIVRCGTATYGIRIRRLAARLCPADVNVRCKCSFVVSWSAWCHIADM